MKIKNTNIADLKVVEAEPNKDDRGVFARLFCERELADLIGPRNILQINYSCTKMVGVIRGLHFQYPPHAEMKLIRCIKGRVWDVAVDLRKGSPTFLRWYAEELTSTNAHMMIIPEGFAHGFQVLEPNSELLYLHTAFFASGFEGGIRFDDPLLGIDWPLAVSDLSQRDQNHPMMKTDFYGIDI